jgi:hypothetical protein
VPCDHALVVEAQERDHVVDVFVGLDDSSSEAWPAREDRVVVNAPILEQGVPDLLRESIALGADADPDTMDYAVNRLVDEIAAIAMPPAARGRVRLQRHGIAAGSAWRDLATRPIGGVTVRERREAEQLTAAYVDELVAAGARACAPLRPATA